MHETTWHTSMERPPKPVGGTFLDLEIAKEFDGMLRTDKVTKRRLPLHHVVANVVWTK